MRKCEVILARALSMNLLNFSNSQRNSSITSGTVVFGHFFPPLSKPIVEAWLIFGLPARGAFSSERF